MSKGFLFELTLKAAMDRAQEYVRARCRKDQSLAGIFHAEFDQHEAGELARKFRNDGNMRDARAAKRIFLKATKRCRNLLAARNHRAIRKPN